MSDGPFGAGRIDAAAVALRRLAAIAVITPPAAARARPMRASGNDVSSPVRGRLPPALAPPDPSAATTLMAAVSLRGAPSDPVHTAMIVCAPSDVLAGMVADILATPDESAAAVPRTTWSDSRVTVTEEPGTHVWATMSMVWPGVGVVSLTVRLF